VVVDGAAVERAHVDATDVDAALRFSIEHALAKLEPAQREAFLLKHVEQLSYDEMALVTGVGVSALKMRVQRACDRLQVLLEDERHA
jgi:RNA polymerase sigma-70 factor, ECF subfamily